MAFSRWNGRPRVAAPAPTAPAKPGQGPKPIPGATVRVALALDASGRERAFRQLRPLLSPGAGRIVIDKSSVTVEGLTAPMASVARSALAVLADEVRPRPPRRRVPAVA